MANTRTYKQSFNGGEVSPDFWGQIGDGKYQSGVATMRNFIALPHGPAQNRTGTKFIREAKPATLLAVRLIPFVYSLDQTYVIEVGENYFRFHTNGATVLFPTTGVLAWNAATNYTQGNLVTYGGFTYYAKTASLNQTPALVSTYWYRQPTTGEYEIPTPYALTDIDELRYAQSNDVLTICHYDTAVQELRRYGATDWRLVELDSGPPISAPTGVTATATVGTGSTVYSYKVTAVDTFGAESAASGSSSCTNNLFTSGNYNTVTWTAVTDAVRYNVYKAASGVFGYIGQADGTSFIDDNIAADFSKTTAITANLKTRYGYPRAVTYYEQRRAFGSFSPHIAFLSNLTPFPQMIVMSKPGTGSDFSYSLPSIDTDSLRFNIASREANVIQHMVPLQELIVLTNAAEWRVSSVDGGGLTPSTIQIKAQSYIGSNAVQPVVVNNNILFAANRGGHVRELAYSFAAGGYLTGDLSLRAPHLFDGYAITDMTLQKAPQQVAWFTSVSGKLLGLTYVPEQQLAAWHQHDTDGAFRSVCAVPEGNEDALYAAVVRTINGTDKVYIERFASRQFAELQDAWFVDCGASYSGASASSASITITGGVTWGPTDSLTLTTSSAFFAYPATTDVGDEIWFYDDLGVKYVLTIQSTSSTTVASATVDKVIDLDEVDYYPSTGATDSITSNPLHTSSFISLTGGGLIAQSTNTFSTWYGGRSVGSHTTGKYYFEMVSTVNDDACMLIGLGTALQDLTFGGNYPGSNAEGWGLWANRSAGLQLYHNGGGPAPIETPLVGGGVASVAVDFDAGKIWFGVNGVWVDGGDPDTGANPNFTFTPNTELYACLSLFNDVQVVTCNFGATAFSQTVPTGFTAWGGTGAAYITVAGNTWDIARDSFSGLSYLEGKTVSILGDGAVFPQKVVTSGTVTLDQAVCKAIIGLPITADLQTLPFAAGIDNAFGQGRQKNVNRAILRVYRSSGIFVGPTTDKLVEAKQRTTEPPGTPPSLKSDEVDVVLTPSWRNAGGQIYIRQADPLPLTVVSLTTEVSLGD